MEKMVQITLYKDELNPQDMIAVETPLTNKVDASRVREELELPQYIDTDCFRIRKCLAILWTSGHAHKIHEIHPNILDKRICSEPINVCFLGGVAIKLHCPSSNVKGPFFRHLNDVDMIVSRKRSGDFKKLLLKLGDICGSQYLNFMTSSERRFTALQAGKRFFMRTFDEIREDGTPRIGVMDVLLDKIEMCHTIDVAEELKNPKVNNYTIGLSKLLLSKAQYIKKISKQEAVELQECGENHRVLPYQYENTLIGMETKDIKDVAVLLLDHQFGEGDDELDLERMARALERDRKLSLTVRLNLQNMLNNIDTIKDFGVTEDKMQIIRSRLEILLKEVPNQELTEWKKPWWNTFVEEVPLPSLT